MTVSTLALARIPTPLGDMVAAATDLALVRLEFVRPHATPVDAASLDTVSLEGRATDGNAITRRAAEEIHEYFEGRGTGFSVPLELAGTAFQRKAWEALRGIPYGETRSYREQAASIGRPRAVRAVARANGANRIAIIVPCHRVIGADGSMTGYGAGVWRKERLLALEQ